MAFGASKKIVVGFGTVLLLIGILGFSSFRGFQETSLVNNELVERLHANMSLEQSIKEHYIWAEDLVGAILGNHPLQSSFNPAQCDFASRLDKLVVDSHLAPQIVGELRTAHAELTQAMSGAIETFQKSANGLEAGEKYASLVEPALNRLESLGEQLDKVSDDEINTALKRENELTIKTEVFLICVSVAAFVISVLVSLVIFLAIRRVVFKLANATNQITSSSNEILAASQEQASGAREQSSAVSETTSAAKELSTTSEMVGDSIKKVAQVAAHAMAGMAKIKDAIDKTNLMLTSLGEKSQKIGKITELIDDVADQTNLLAVNASIEAARAGEQGRGFTVVADEIRKLADSTAKSTKDITALIELIQHEMSNAIVSMEQSVTSVDEEARLAQQTTEKAKEIAMSANQQISGSKQIADAMLNIDEAMKQIAAGASQSQTAARQLMELATELKNMMALLK